MMPDKPACLMVEACERDCARGGGAKLRADVSLHGFSRLPGSANIKKRQVCHERQLRAPGKTQTRARDTSSCFILCISILACWRVSTWHLGSVADPTKPEDNEPDTIKPEPHTQGNPDPSRQLGEAGRVEDPFVLQTGETSCEYRISIRLLPLSPFGPSQSTCRPASSQEGLIWVQTLRIFSASPPLGRLQGPEGSTLTGHCWWLFHQAREFR